MDPKGEEAYLRCFEEAKKCKPPRVPNAQFFENSPSAREAVARRDKELFKMEPSTGKPERRRNPTYAPAPIDHRKRAAMAAAAMASLSAPESATGSTSPTEGPFAQTQGPEMAGGLHTGLVKHNGYADQRHHQGQTSPMPREPKFIPPGPGRMLR